MRAAAAGRPAGRWATAAWLGVGAVLTTATQLRFHPSLGPGELMLAAWVAAALPSAAGGRTGPGATALRPFVRFWMAALVLLLAGWATGAWLGRVPHDAARDLAAYLLVAAVVGLLALRPGGEEEVRRAAQVTLFVGVGALLPLVVPWVLWIARVGPLELFYQGRFQGWSRNPNQVAIAMCALPFLALWWARRSRGPVRWGYAAALAGSVLVGLASESDALVLAWMTAGSLLVAHAWLLAVRGGAASTARGWAVLVGVPLLATALVLADGRVPRRLVATLERTYSEEASGPERLELWRNGLRSAAASPVVGLGPGSHSRPSIHTWGDRAGPIEAHNILIDWGACTGLAGVVILLALLGVVARRALRDPPLLAALVALFVVGMAQYHLRHPVVWLHLLFVAVAAREARLGGGVADGHSVDEEASTALTG